jgi:hypothetical protein
MKRLAYRDVGLNCDFVMDGSPLLWIEVTQSPDPEFMGNKSSSYATFKFRTQAK